jgi:tetratricopeptide (TPR) repeat protein
VVDERAQELERLAEAEERGDQAALVAALARLTERALQDEDYDGAVGYCGRYLELVERYGITPLVAVALGNLGVAERRRGNYQEAVRCYERQLALVRATE